jgi:hypothetical protein
VSASCRDDDFYCNLDRGCPLYESCLKIVEEIEEKFLGNVKDWKPTGLSVPEKN